MGSCGVGCVVIGASRISVRSGVRVMYHVQQAKLTALHLKPRILRRDIGATVGSDFPRKPWLDIRVYN